MSTLFSSHYLRNRSTLHIGVLGYMDIIQHKEHSPEVFGGVFLMLKYTDITQNTTVQKTSWLQRASNDVEHFLCTN